MFLIKIKAFGLGFDCSMSTVSMLNVHCTLKMYLFLTHFAASLLLLFALELLEHTAHVQYMFRLNSLDFFGKRI